MLDPFVRKMKNEKNAFIQNDLGVLMRVRDHT